MTDWPARTYGIYARHREVLDRAVRAIDAGERVSPFGSDGHAMPRGRAAWLGEAAFQTLRGRVLDLDQPGARGTVATESSPYGIELGVSYPYCEPDELVRAAGRAMAGWRAAGPHERAGVAVEILHRLSDRSVDMTHALHHTTGQSFATAYRTGGPAALDRALQAVAHAFAESVRSLRVPEWSQRPGRSGRPLIRGVRTVVPRGISLLVGCPVLPLWNGFPGLFASLVTGNPVIVKPHAGAVLPLALTVQTARNVLEQGGYDPNVITLAVEEPGEQLVARLATDPAVRIIDHTGPARFGDWLSRHARQATVFSTMAGLNTVVVDSTDDYEGMLGHLAVALSLCGGRLSTTPQNILVPVDGIETDKGHKPFEHFCSDLSDTLDRLLSHPRRAAGILGAITSDTVRSHLTEAARHGTVVRPSLPVRHPDHDAADIRTPLVVRVTAEQEEVYAQEWPGPVSFVIATDSTVHSLDVFRRTVGRHGAQFASVHSTDRLVLAAAEVASHDAGAHLSENPKACGPITQNAILSDLHGTSTDPAAFPPLTDPAFVAGRFLVLHARRHAVERPATDELIGA
ncbi:phenylacetic acid degradation protein PaaN [Streptomyces sp. NPDC002577]